MADVFGLVIIWSTIFSNVETEPQLPGYFTSSLGSLKCLAQGYFLAVLGIELWTSGVQRSTT